MRSDRALTTWNERRSKIMIGVDFCAAEAQDVQHCALVQLFLCGEQLVHPVLVPHRVHVAGVGDGLLAVPGLSDHRKVNVDAVDDLHRSRLH